MTNSTKRNSVVEELRKKVTDYRQELLQILQDWHYLQNILQPRLVFLYDSLFGELDFELSEKSRIAATLERRVELMYQRIHRGEQLTERTIEIINRIVSKEFEISEKKYIGTPSIQRNHGNCYNENDIPLLYRQIVKKLHPDISNNNEYFNRFWYSVQDAYKSKNLQRLQLFHQSLCPEEESVFRSEYSEELALRNTIRQLKMNIMAEKRKMERIKKQEPFSFENKLNNQFWVAQRRNLLREQIFKTNRKIRKHRQLLQAITGRTYSAADLFGERKYENQIVNNSTVF